MGESQLYILEFLFDGSEVDQEDLRAQVNKAIDRQRDSPIELTVETVRPPGTSACLKLSLRGSLEDVDRSHYRIRRDVADSCRCILIRDDAGDEIRQRAYPILAELERSLRTFISRAMTEIIGFDWWEAMAPRAVRERVKEVPADENRDHPVELTYFDDLMELVTGSVKEWAENRPVSVADLLELVDGCSSTDELQARVAEKTRSVSLWDEVFGRYYPGEQEKQRWSELSETVTKTVVPMRHRVMHHRPVFLWQLERVREAQEEAQQLIDSATAQLPEDERVEARQATKQLGQTIAETAEMLTRTYAQAGAFSKTSEIAQRILSQATFSSETAVMLARMYAQAGAFSKTSEMVRRILAQAGSLSQMAEMLARVDGRVAIRDLSAEPMQGDMPRVASTQGSRFHRPSCSYAGRILPANLISFATRDDALDQGYSPCTACQP